jgi:glutamine amidotransferase
MISIVDYGVGNIGAISNMLNHLRVPNQITSSSKELLSSQGLILPGVGSFDRAMQNLNSKDGVRKAVDIFAKDLRKPLLGICLGMQMMGSGSEEGVSPGLGWIDTSVIKFPKSLLAKVPNMGWRKIKPIRKDEIMKDLPFGSRFYFSHSYYMPSNSNCLATAENGIEFSAVIRFDNIYGAQFHPEKSHSFGMKFLTNFARIANE